MPFLTTRGLSDTKDASSDLSLNSDLDPSSSSSSSSGSNSGSGAGSSSSAPFPLATVIAISFGGLAAIIVFIGVIIVVRSRISAWKAEIEAANNKLRLAQTGFGDNIDNGAAGGNESMNGNGDGGNRNGNRDGGTPARLPSVKRLKPLSFLQGREGPKEWEIREKQQKNEGLEGANAREGVMERLSRASSSARKSIKSHAGKLQRSLSRKTSTKLEVDGPLASAQPSSSRTQWPSRHTPDRTPSPPGPSQPVPPPKPKPVLNLQNGTKRMDMDDEISMSVLKYIGDSPNSSPMYPPSVSRDRVYDPTREQILPSPRKHTRDISNVSSISASATAVSGTMAYARRPSDANVNLNVYPIYEDEARPSTSSQNTRYDPPHLVQPSHNRNASSISNISPATVKAYTSYTNAYTSPHITNTDPLPNLNNANARYTAPSAPNTTRNRTQAPAVSINPVAIVTTGVQSARERRDTLSILSPVTPITASTPSTYATTPSAYSQSTHSHAVPSQPGQHAQSNYPYQSFVLWNDASGSPTMSFPSSTLSQRRPGATGISSAPIQQSLPQSHLPRLQTSRNQQNQPQPQEQRIQQNQGQSQRSGHIQHAQRPSVEVAPVHPLNIQKRPSETPSIPYSSFMPFEPPTPTDAYVHPYAQVAAASHARTGSQARIDTQVSNPSHSRTVSNAQTDPHSHSHTNMNTNTNAYTHTRNISNTNMYSPKRPIATNPYDLERKGGNAPNAYPRRI